MKITSIEIPNIYVSSVLILRFSVTSVPANRCGFVSSLSYIRKIEV